MGNYIVLLALAVGLLVLSFAMFGPAQGSGNAPSVHTGLRFTGMPEHPSFGNTMDLQFLVVDAETLEAVAGAEVTILQTGDRRVTNAWGIARFETGPTATFAYYPKGTDFKVTITHAAYPLSSFVYMTPSGCTCPQDGRSKSHYEVRLGSAFQPGSASEGVPPAKKDCFRLLASQEELDCTSRMGNTTTEDDAPSLGCVTYVRGRPASQKRISEEISTTRKFYGEVGGQLGGALSKLGFVVEAKGRGTFQATKKLVVDETLGMIEMPGCSGEVCVRQIVMKFVEEEWCKINGEWRRTRTRESYSLGQGTCTDTSRLDCQ